MKNKTWFITGSSRGFGNEWATAALQRGDNTGLRTRTKNAWKPGKNGRMFLKRRRAITMPEMRLSLRFFRMDFAIG